MAYVKIITKRNGKEIAEVFVKGEELCKVLKQQGIPSSNIKIFEEYCLTFQLNEEEKY